MYGFDPAPGDVGDPDAPARQGEQLVAQLEAAQDDLAKIVGTGKGPSKHVAVSVDHEGRVLDVTFDARAMRLTSRDLADEVLAAIGEAVTDAERQTIEMLREAIPGYDPVAARAELERALAGWA
ncbi:YbaB/EbfC family nucleoid-associated protein [Nonomuraea diastatica]|uniref:YbaB/EbfC family nucleoid-associated protein n=1 Tax=Nonomuraea diastatica TaxID=1848329 RepID=UPI00140D4E12|nr:YbaB/EbfC family nucleoid-associated protein [Nonomuraea diastatica]